MKTAESSPVWTVTRPEAIVKELDEMGLLVRIEDYTHNVGTHDRCKTTVEPLIKKQWFVKMAS